jgi:hypothetical protein
LLRTAGIDGPDGGMVELKERGDVTRFAHACAKLRFFERDRKKDRLSAMEVSVGNLR